MKQIDRSSRRDVLKAITATALGASTPALSQATDDAAPLRVAHLTDMHVQPERDGGGGYAAALRSLDALARRPDLIITGGDHIMDSFDTDSDRARLQWDLYEKVLSASTSLPVYPVMGNHDVWAWGEKSRHLPTDTAGYGKALAMDRLKLKRSFYSFDAGGWHFIILDNVTREEFAYIGWLDDEQAEWLRSELTSSRSKPICVVSHIPLLCACAYFDGERFTGKYYHIPDAWMHRNVKPLLLLMRDNNVKLCLSGHIHQVDAVQYLGISFFCNGAVSGNWWKGPHEGFPEGYGITDLWPDGRFENRYVGFNWAAKPD